MKEMEYITLVAEIRDQYKGVELNKKQIAKLITERLGGAESTHYFQIVRIKDI